MGEKTDFKFQNSLLCVKTEVRNMNVNFYYKIQVKRAYKIKSKFLTVLEEGITSRFVIYFLPRSKRLLIPWLQSPSAVILEPKKIKSVTVFIVSPSICHEVMGPNAMILVF